MRDPNKAKVRILPVICGLLLWSMEGKLFFLEKFYATKPILEVQSLSDATYTNK